MVAALKSRSVQSGEQSRNIREDRHFQDQAVTRLQTFQKGVNAAQAHPSRSSNSNKVISRSVRSQPSLTTIAPLPKPSPRPLWLKLLLRCQQGSTVVTGTLMLSLLAVYSSTVSLNSQVSQGTQQLADFHRDRQQLTAANEVLKHHMAEQAEAPGAGLNIRHPNSMLFLNSSSPTGETAHEQAVPSPLPTHEANALGQRPFSPPLGY